MRKMEQSETPCSKKALNKRREFMTKLYAHKILKQREMEGERRWKIVFELVIQSNLLYNSLIGNLIMTKHIRVSVCERERPLDYFAKLLNVLLQCES